MVNNSTQKHTLGSYSVIGLFYLGKSYSFSGHMKYPSVVAHKSPIPYITTKNVLFEGDNSRIVSLLMYNVVIQQ